MSLTLSSMHVKISRLFLGSEPDRAPLTGTALREAASEAVIQTHSDHDLRDRSVAGIWAYPALWIAIVLLTDVEVERPMEVYGSGVLIALASSWRLWLWRGFAAQYERSPHRWRRWFIAAATASALAWALFTGLVLLRGVLDGATLLVIMASAGIMAGMMVGFVAYRPLQISSSALLVLIPSLSALMTANPAVQSTAALMLVYWAYLTLMGKRLHRDFIWGQRAALDVEQRANTCEATLEGQRETTTRLQALIAKAPAGVLVEDANRKVVLVNQNLCRLFGITAKPETLVGADCAGMTQSFKELFTDPEAFLWGVNNRVTQHREMLGEELPLADGRVFERDYIPVVSGGEFYGHMWQYRDATERKRSEAELLYLAHYDPATRLANRTLLHERLRMGLAHARRNGRKLALLYVDLDGFKEINDSLGHAAGDETLRIVADRLRAVVRDTDAVARLGGDEFVMLFYDLTDAANAVPGALKVLSALATPIELGKEKRTVTASIGISVFPEHGDSEQQLLDCADKAMYSAKQAGANTYRFYEGNGAGAIARRK